MSYDGRKINLSGSIFVVFITNSFWYLMFYESSCIIQKTRITALWLYALYVLHPYLSRII